jgi:uncharacterized protein (TIGR02996 family)
VAKAKKTKPKAPKPSAEPIAFPDAEALLEAIRANPTDDKVRLVYADALQELGDPRGEYIALALGGKQHAAAAKALLAKHRTKWQDFGIGGMRYEWDRGFIDRITARLGKLDDKARRLFELHPVRELRFHDAERIDLVPLFRWPLHGLQLFMARLVPDALAAFARCTTMPNLVDMCFEETDFGKHAALVGRASFPKLTHLYLGECDITDAQLAALVKGPFLSSVISLGLPQNPIGDDGIVAFARSPAIANLEVLNLSNTDVAEKGVVALAASPHLGKLETLRLDGNRYDTERTLLGPAAANALAAAATTTFANLKELELASNLSPEAKPIVRAAYGDRLRA